MKVRVGNFNVQKIEKTLSKSSMQELRDGVGIPKQIAKHLDRKKIPVIEVSSISGGWKVSYMIGLSMFNLIDGCFDGYTVVEMGVLQLINDIYFNCCIIGDGEYLKKRNELVREYLDRIKPEDDKGETPSDVAEAAKAEIPLDNPVQEGGES